MQGLQVRHILRDASLIAALSAAGILVPIAVGYATTPKSAAQLEQERLDAFEASVEGRRKLIDSEISAAAGQGWAADYYEGDGLGANILISVAPKSGIAATWHGCMGLYGANLGTIIPQQDASLQFKF